MDVWTAPVAVYPAEYFVELNIEKLIFLIIVNNNNNNNKDKYHLFEWFVVLMLALLTHSQFAF